MRGPRLDDFCGFLGLGCCGSQFRGIPQFRELFSPAPPEGALALLSGFGDYGSGSRLLGPSGSVGAIWKPGCEASMSPGLYSSLVPLVQKERRGELIGWDHLIQLPLYHYLEGEAGPLRGRP